MKQIAYFPAYKKNPYQRLWYDAVADEFEARPLEDVTEISSLGRSVAADTLHLHWEDFAYVRRGLREKAAGSLALLSGLAKYKKSGGRLVWTVHNDRPHAAHNRFLFRLFRSRIVKLADVIHAHSQIASDALVRDYGADPARIRVIPHPSYVDLYGPPRKTPSAQRRFLFFGQFRASKGVADLISALSRVRAGDDWRLTVRSRVFKDQRPLAEQLEALPNVTVQRGFVEESEVEEVFSHADVLVAPFRSVSTSGSIILAMGFGTPVIAPAEPSLIDYVPDEARVLLFRPGDVDDLTRKIERARALPQDELEAMSRACRAQMEAIRPSALADRYKTLFT